MKKGTLSYKSNKFALHAAFAVILAAAILFILSSHSFADTGTSAAAKVNADNGAYLRKSASVLSGKVELLSNDTEIVLYREVFKSKTDTDPEQVWYYAKAGEKSGYIRSDLVKDIRYSNVEAVTKNGTNYRAGAGIKMENSGRLKKNSKVTVCLEATPDKGAEGSNATWYKIEIDSKYYYVCSGNVKITGKVKAPAAAEPAQAPAAQPAEQVKTEAAPAAQPAAAQPAQTPAAQPAAAAEPAQTPAAQPAAVVFAETAIPFDKVQAALKASTAVKGVALPDTITVLKSAGNEAEFIVELNKNTEVTVKSAVTTQEKTEDGDQITEKWYEIEFSSAQVIAIGDPEAEEDTSAPAYLDPDQEDDSELEAANDTAEKELVGTDEDEDTDDPDIEEGSYTGILAEGTADANGVIRGFVRAADLAAFPAK